MNSRSTKIKKIDGVPFAVVPNGDGVYMFVRKDSKTTSSIELLYSFNGVDFIKKDNKIFLKNLSGKKEKLSDCDRFSVSKTPNGYVMTYVRMGKKNTREKIRERTSMLVVSRSTDMHEWLARSELAVDEFHHTTMVYDKTRDSFELYRDGLFIKHQSSPTLSVWKNKPGLVFTSRNDYFDSEKLSIIGSVSVEEGILMLYDASVEKNTNMLLQVGAVVLDKNNPKRVIWRSSFPVWQGIVEANKKSLPTGPLGFVPVGGNYLIYWLTKDNNLILVKIKSAFKEKDDRLHPKILDRHESNPIVEPRTYIDWEAEGTFNPAAFEDDEGTIYLLYRAVGRDGISRVGYAKSKDGVNFTNRLPSPVFEPLRDYKKSDVKVTSISPQEYNPIMYTSGGSWYGSEDPRTVLIEGMVYMIFMAFEGWGSARLALTSISLEDFKAGKWTWRKPIKISPPGHYYKNWLLFPEKINGKFAIIHSIEPDVLIEYVDNPEDLEDKNIISRHPYMQKERSRVWDTKMRGPGAPPVRTELGWLLLYHATQKQEPHKYKLGAMILDINDPTKILYRSKHPILSPDMHYENNGKPGVVYASGAVTRGDDLYIYYGGADKVVCVATTSLSKLLKYLQTGNAKSYKLEKVKK